MYGRFTSVVPAVRFVAYSRGGYLRIDISDAFFNETIRVLRDKFQSTFHFWVTTPLLRYQSYSPIMSENKSPANLS